MNIVQVYDQVDLDNVNCLGTVACDVYIHGGETISLHGIKRIIGYLGFANVNHINLNDIEEIGGNLWVSTYHTIPKRIDLCRLRRIGGSLNLDNTPLDNLGVLEYVGGNASLRNTNIQDLGKLSYVGGNLYLPKKLKGNVDLSNIEIKGFTRYFEPIELAKTQKGLTPSDRPIPVINKKNSYGIVHNYIDSLSQATAEQVEFFNYFKSCFEKGIILDVKEYVEYPRFLLQSMMMSMSKPLPLWLNDYDRIIKAYPYPYLENMVVEYFVGTKQYEIAWEVFKKSSIITESRIGFFEEKLSQKLFNANLLVKIVGAIDISPWARQHIEDIIPFIQIEIDGFERDWGRRFLQVFVDKTLNPQRSYDFYRQFYITEEFFNEVNSWEYGKYCPENYEKYPFPHIARHAILQQCKKISITAEDSYRKSIGMPLIGEFWRSETELYYSIKEAFKEVEVKQHASPKWLGRQHLDVFIPKYKIGLEYQGAQHYRPIDFFGGEEAFIKGQERDAKKKKLCDENGCTLIYVDEGYDLNALVKQIKQIISSLSPD